VPVALNGDCARQELPATFMKRIKGHFANEIAIVTPNGAMLSTSPEEALKKWQQLPRSTRRTVDALGNYEGAREPSPPAGGLILKVFARPLVRDPSGGLAIYRNPKAHLSKEPGRDHLWLTRPEWRSLLPAQAEVGERVTVPGPIADRLCRRYLIDLVRIGGEGGPRRPEDVLSRGLVLTVAEGSSGRVSLQLHGAVR